MSGVKQNDCEHHFGSLVRGGEPLAVRICTLCWAVDWNDLREQLAPLTARAERAEAAIAEAQRTLSSRHAASLIATAEAWQQRAERAEAAVRRVRELHRQVIDSSWPAPGHCLECVDAGGDAMDYRPYPCATIAALDSTDPVEDAPEGSDEGPKRCPSKITDGLAVRQCVGRAEPFEHLHSAGDRTWLSGDPDELLRSDAGLPADGEERTDG